MQLPDGYVDPHPERGPWTSVSTPPAPYAADLSVLLPDGTTEPATWTGKVWWRNYLTVR
jgi:hypothetical protein